MIVHTADCLTFSDIMDAYNDNLVGYQDAWDALGEVGSTVRQSARYRIAASLNEKQVQS